MRVRDLGLSCCIFIFVLQYPSYDVYSVCRSNNMVVRERWDERILHAIERYVFLLYVFLYLIEQVNRQGNNGILVEYFFDCVIAWFRNKYNRRGEQLIFDWNWVKCWSETPLEATGPTSGPLSKQTFWAWHLLSVKLWAWQGETRSNKAPKWFRSGEIGRKTLENNRFSAETGSNQAR